MSVAFLDALISGARSTSANRFEPVVTSTDCRSLLTSSAGLAARQERVTEVDHCSTFLWSCDVRAKRGLRDRRGTDLVVVAGRLPGPRRPLRTEASRVPMPSCCARRPRPVTEMKYQ